MPLPQLQIGDNLLDDALLASVQVEQELNRHWWCTVTCRNTSDRRIPIEQLMGQPLEVTTKDDAGAAHLQFSGFIYDVALRYEISGAYTATLKAVSKSYRMDVTRVKRYFSEQTLGGLAQTMAADSGSTVAVNVPARKKLDYVQFGETDFAFLNRVVDDYAAWLRPTATGVEIHNSFQAGSSTQWRDDKGLIRFALSASMVPPSITGAHYDHHAMQSATLTGVTGSPQYYDGAASLVSAVLSASAQLPSGFAPTRARAVTMADFQTQLMAENERDLGGAVTGRGTSRSQALKAGDTLAITGQLDAKGTYGLVRVVHQWTTKGYSNDFVCTPWKSYRNPHRPALRSWEGLVPARVTAHNDPGKQGRIQVQFHWQGRGTTRWARALSPHAGPGRGFMFLPEVGDEVEVMFEDGDPERPIVVGSAWNGVHQAPRAGFFSPEADIPSNDVKRLFTKSGNRMQLIDTPSQETVLLATPHHTRAMMTEKSTSTGRPLVYLHSDGDIILSAPTGRVHVQSRFFSREVGTKAGGAGKGLLPVVGNTGASPKDDLCLGVNARYADNVRAAAKRTGADPAALASFVNAEAARDKDGTWKADSKASGSSAQGLMQFLSGTWKGQATTPGTALNESAVQNGYVQPNTAANGKTTYSVVPGQESNLLAMRDDPQTSLTAGSEYLKQNQDSLAAHGLIPDDATDDEKTQLGYIAHHEGATGARQLLTGTIPDKKIDGLMDANMSADQQAKYLKENGNDKQKAYAAFVKDYAKKKINPDDFRCSKQQH